MSKNDRWGTDGTWPEGEALRRVQKNISRVMVDVLSDARKGISESASMIPQRANETPRTPSGGSVPIEQPPGLRWVDQQLDAQAEKDRAALVRQRMEDAWFEARFDKGPRVEHDYNPFDSRSIRNDD
jgi:hypothetical protein